MVRLFFHLTHWSIPILIVLGALESYGRLTAQSMKWCMWGTVPVLEFGQIHDYYTCMFVQAAGFCKLLAVSGKFEITNCVSKLGSKVATK